MRHFYYMLDEQNNIIETEDVREWGLFFRDFNRRKIARDELEDGHVISTVFLGIDHGPFTNRDRRPVLFESMIFDPKGNDIYMCRYHTWDEAEKGHKALLDSYIWKE